jgi:HPt (histidine-containing phosphotransfer) domain-containing protein
MQPDPMEVRLGQLRRLGGDKLIAELIDLFFKTTPQRLEAIRAAVEGGDPAAAARAAHSLTSSAGNLGAVALQQLAAALEERAAAGAADALPDLVRRLEEAWGLARDALAARREGLEP